MSAQRQAIEIQRRILTPGISLGTGITEYFDPNIQARVVRIPTESPSVDTHEKLSLERMPVFSSIHDDEGNVKLLIPKGTRTLAHAMVSLSRNVEGYRTVFTGVGRILKSLNEANFGTLTYAPGRPILASLAFSTETTSDFGATLNLIPPYAFTNDSPESCVTAIDVEIRRFGQLALEGRRLVISYVQEGLNGGMDHGDDRGQSCRSVQ